MNQISFIIKCGKSLSSFLLITYSVKCSQSRRRLFKYVETSLEAEQSARKHLRPSFLNGCKAECQENLKWFK